MDVVSEAISKANKLRENFKPITVNKLIDLEYDLGTLLTIDTNDLNIKDLRYCMSLCFYIKFRVVHVSFRIILLP